MTHTTTDAAEARAPDYIEMAAARMRSIAAIPDMVIDAALNATVPGGARVAAWLPDSVERDVIRYALHAAFATAEAASGAGEREFTDAQLKDAVTELLDHRGERSRRVLRNGQELWETWLPAFRAAIRYLPAASLPPATDPAIQKLEQTLLLARSWINHTRSCAFWTHTPTEDGYRIDCTCPYGEHVAYIDAALAAAPTIPATGEAVLRLREVATCQEPVVTVATSDLRAALGIPATGHAATEPVTNAYNLAATEGEGASHADRT